MRDAFKQLAARGVPAMLSNSDTLRVRELYARWPVVRIDARRSVGSTEQSRGRLGELVICNYG